MPVFEPYLDATDLTACVEASETAQALNARLAPQAAFWPLYLKAEQALGELFLTARHCSRGFRYGSLGDNVLGLVWRLPNGTRVDLGGRTVKNVTGFDLVRFLAGSGGRLGRPERLVLRLRPRPQAESVLRLEGAYAQLRRAARTLRASSWAHALEALDLEADSGAAGLLLAFGGKPEVLPLFEAQAQAWAQEHGLRLRPLEGLPERNGRPWAQVQAPVDELPELAETWLARHGGRLCGFLGSGRLHIESLEGNEAGALQSLRELHQRLAASGGHCEHPALEADSAAPQARWEARFRALLESVA